MAETNLGTVKEVLAAMRAQDVETALRHFDVRFVQHAPFVAGGVEGLRRHLLGSSPDQLKLTLVRAIEDGPLVVAQMLSEASGENLFHVYRFQNGLIAEQWTFSSPTAPPNQSGHTQLDGPTEPKDLGETEKNKAIVTRYYKTFHLAGHHERNPEFFTGDRMIRHEPGVRDGLGEFLRDVASLMQHRTIDAIKLVVGQGDLVFIAATGTHEARACVYLDLYRVENSSIVEHWGFPQPVPAASERSNTNGML